MSLHCVYVNVFVLKSESLNKSHQHSILRLNAFCLHSFKLVQSGLIQLNALLKSCEIFFVPKLLVFTQVDSNGIQITHSPQQNNFRLF